MEEVSEKVIYTGTYQQCLRFSCLENLLLRLHRKNPAEEDWRHSFNKERLVKDLSHSVYYRRILKENSVEDVLNLLMQDAPSLELLKGRPALIGAIREVKKNMGEATIIRLPWNAEIVVDGRVYRGIDSLKGYAKMPDSPVLCRSQRFPCFDSSDYMYEKRYYRNFWFCKQDPEMSELISSLEEPRFNYCFLKENLRKEAFPMVYYVDEEKTLLFGYNED